MCPPTYFDIEYEINPWMHRENPVNTGVARGQWDGLYEIYSQRLGWEVQVMMPGRTSARPRVHRERRSDDRRQGRIAVLSAA